MSLVADLAALIAERRAVYDRALESDLRACASFMAERVVREALRLAQTAEGCAMDISIVGTRRRKQRGRAAQREAQLLFRTKR